MPQERVQLAVYAKMAVHQAQENRGRALKNRLLQPWRFFIAWWAYLVLGIERFLSSTPVRLASAITRFKLTWLLSQWG